MAATHTFLLFAPFEYFDTVPHELNNSPADKQEASGKHWSRQCAPSLFRQGSQPSQLRPMMSEESGGRNQTPNTSRLLPCLPRRPQNNGKFCPGSGRFSQLCNTRPCPPHAVDFRAQQCAEYNSKPFRGWYYKWKPYTKVDGKLAPFVC